MDDAEITNRCRLALLLGKMALMLALYGLSIGPAAQLSYFGFLPFDAMGSAFAPVFVICSKSEIADDVTTKYIRWWYYISYRLYGFVP